MKPDEFVFTKSVAEISFEDGLALVVLEEEGAQLRVSLNDTGLCTPGCDYISDGTDPCDIGGLFAPQSIDIFEG